MDSKTVEDVWQKGEHFNDNFKKDQCGALIKKDAYGNRQSKYGWEIDHIKPQSEGGTDVLSNLRPLHWKNNVSRQANRLNTTNPTVKAFLKTPETKVWDNAEYNETSQKYDWI